jgi:hypothetical protein
MKDEAGSDLLLLRHTMGGEDLHPDHLRGAAP